LETLLTSAERVDNTIVYKLIHQMAFFSVISFRRAVISWS